MLRPAQMLGETTPMHRWCFFVGARHAVPGTSTWLRASDSSLGLTSWGAQHAAPGTDAWRDDTDASLVFLRGGTACRTRHKHLAPRSRFIAGSDFVGARYIVPG